SAAWPRGVAPETEWLLSQKQHSEQCNASTANRWNHPINCVSWQQASAYCEAQGARLPTEAEWEFAARGPDSRTYPWGNQTPTVERLNGCGTECELWHETVGLGTKAASPL